jgi:plastocyanin
VAAIVLLGASAYATATFKSEPSRSGDVQLGAKNFEFQPKTLETDGPNVRVFFTNPDPSLHTFTIDALGVDLAVPPGKSRRVEFSGNPGSYDFYCKPHPEMKGKLVVS